MIAISAMFAHLSDRRSRIDPKPGIWNPEFSVNHERFASLLWRIVIAGLVLAGVVFVQMATGVVPGGTLPGTAAALAPAFFVLVFVLWNVLSAFRPWSGLELSIGSAIAAVLVLDSAIGPSSALGVGIHAVPLLGPQLTRVVFVILLAALLGAYLSYRLNQTYGLLGVLFLVTTPPMLGPDRMSVWLVFYGTAALLCLFLWCETGKPLWLITAGLGLGLAACGHAWKAAFLVVALGLGLMVLLSRRSQPWDATTGSALVLLFSSIIAFGTWEVIAVSTASPDGFAQTIFASPPAAFSSLRHSGEDATMATIAAAVANSLLALPLGEVRLPSALVLGPAAVGFLPWCCRGKWAYEKRALLIMALLVVLATSSSGALKFVGLLPICPLLAILAAYGIHNLYMNVKRPALLFIAVVVLLIWNGLTFWKTIA